MERKKKSNSSSLVEEEKHPTKRKKPINTGYSISLEWDEQNKSVVARRQQIGILHTHIAPFTHDPPPCYTNLAGLLNLPSPTFDLKDLTGVLSYEVWRSHFSDAERTILTHYLPRGADPDILVQELLSGDNFHFGNPFLKWGASLCSGKLHPDQVLHREQYLNANKKMFLSELQKYHNDMIESLQRWKDTLDRCKDPQEEVLQNIWKSRKQSKKRMNLCEMLYHNEDDDVNTPECSDRATSDKACSNNFLHIHGDCHRRNDLSDSNVNETPDGLKVAVKPQTEEKLQKRNVQLGDGAKHMSYIKVFNFASSPVTLYHLKSVLSKEQHHRVGKTRSLTGNNIQPRSLNNALANIDTLHIQPFEVFEEEERQKLHDYWFRLATKDFPAFYANWRERKLKTQESVKSVCQELEEKLILQEKNDENNNSHNLSPAELANNVDTAVSPRASVLENEEDEKTDYTHQLQKYHGIGSMEEDGGSDTSSAKEEGKKMEAIKSRPQVTDKTVDSHGGDIIDKEVEVDSTLILSEFPGNMNHIIIPGAVGEGDHLNPGSDVWSAVMVPGSFYHPAALDNQNASSNEFSLVHSQVMDNQPGLMIDVEAEAQEQGTRREAEDLCFHDSFITQQCRDVPFITQQCRDVPFINQQCRDVAEKNDGRQPEHVSFFSGYPTQETLLRVHGGLLAYQPAEQKRMGLDFDEAGSVMAENGERRMNEMNFEECVYPNGGRCRSPGKLEDWGVESWFPGENQGRCGWPGLESGATLSRSSNLDQTLFSVLSGCDELRAAATSTSMPYESMVSGEGMVEQSSEPVRIPTSLEWMGVSHHNSGFLSSWNH